MKQKTETLVSVNQLIKESANHFSTAASLRREQSVDVRKLQWTGGALSGRDVSERLTDHRVSDVAGFILARLEIRGCV